MTWIMVLWLGWSCPGGMLSGFIPHGARPLVCRPAPEMERFDPAQMDRARARVREQGASSKIYSCDARRCREIAVRWRTETEFGE